jgi:hypothetical protein
MFYQLLMLFWPVNEMTELVSGMPEPQFGDEYSWVRGSELVHGSNGSCVSFWLRYGVFAYLHRYAYPRFKTITLNHLDSSEM